MRRKTGMFIYDLLTAVLGGVSLIGLIAFLLRVWGYQLEIRIKPSKRRRRRPVEPDEHTAFL